MLQNQIRYFWEQIRGSKSIFVPKSYECGITDAIALVLLSMVTR
jgi:hypothetical protein